MDLFRIGIVAVIALLTLIAASILFVRWRRNRYRFTVRALLLAFALIGCALFVLMRYVAPALTHRWAIQRIYSSGGEVLFRVDYEAARGRGVGFGLSDAGSGDNPWREVLSVSAKNDQEAINLARQLKYLPEVKGIYLGYLVTDAGLASICAIGPHSSLETLELFESRITNSGLSQLPEFTRLKTLLFNTCPIGDAGLAHLKSVPNLRTLWLIEEGKQANPSRFTEQGFAEIGNLEKLNTLNFVGLHISDAAARHLHSLIRLKTLGIMRCVTSDEAIADLGAALPECAIVQRE